MHILISKVKIQNCFSAMTVNAQVFQEEVQPFFYITVAVPTQATGCSKAFAKEGKTAFESPFLLKNTNLTLKRQ